MISRENEEKKSGFCGRFTFSSQHQQKGGSFACASIVTYASAYFLSLKTDEFFRYFYPPNEKKSTNPSDELVNSEKATDQLNKVISFGVALHQEFLHYSKDKDSQSKGSLFASLHQFYLNLSGNDSSEILKYSKKITSNLHGDNLENLKIIDNLVVSHANRDIKSHEVSKVINEIYDNCKQYGVPSNNICIYSNSAMHATLFFSRVHPESNIKYYYIFDSSPSRSVGGERAVGTMEIYNNRESAIHELLERWKWWYRDNAGDILAVMTIATRQVFDEGFYRSKESKSESDPSIETSRKNQ